MLSRKLERELVDLISVLFAFSKNVTAIITGTDYSKTQIPQAIRFSHTKIVQKIIDSID